MKVRNGFVSNSSSSSFVTTIAEPLCTALEVARAMVPFRKYDSDGDLIDTINAIEEWLIERGKDDEVLLAVKFTSCNYDTYIFEYDGRFYIDTCNNHHWRMSQHSFDWADGWTIEHEKVTDHYKKVHFLDLDVANRLRLGYYPRVCPVCDTMTRYHNYYKTWSCDNMHETDEPNHYYSFESYLEKYFEKEGVKFDENKHGIREQ